MSLIRFAVFCTSILFCLFVTNNTFATVPAFHPACARLLGPQTKDVSPEHTALSVVTARINVFTKEYDQEARDQLSWDQELKRSLIHKLTKDSPENALYLLSPETHADSVVITSAIQKGQDLNESLASEFNTAQKNVRAKLERLNGNSAQSIANRLKALPLEYKRALLRLRVLEKTLEEHGPLTDKNSQETFSLKMPAIDPQTGNMTHKDEVFTLEQVETNIRTYKNRAKAHETQRDELLYRTSKTCSRACETPRHYTQSSRINRKRS